MAADPLTRLLEAADKTILSVGSGDGSQQAAIVARGHRNVTTTFFDSRAALLAKYPQSAPASLRVLEGAARPPLFEVDATNLQSYGLGMFDICIFSFPHTGVPNNDPNNVASNRALLTGFLRSVQHVLKPDGQVQITLKTGEPYDRWELPRLLSDECDLHLTSTHPLDKSQFTGYVHRLTVGATGKMTQVRDKGAKVYSFERRQPANAEPTVAQLPLSTSASVVIVALLHAALSYAEVETMIGEVLHAARGEAESLSVLDIRRRAAGRCKIACATLPDTRQMNRVLYAMEHKGCACRGGSRAGRGMKPAWMAPAE